MTDPGLIDPTVSPELTTAISQRIPAPAALPQLPERDMGIALETTDGLRVLPEYSALVLTGGPEPNEEDPIRILIDAIGGDYITWCPDKERYMSYTAEKLQELFMNGDMKLYTPEAESATHG